LDLGADDYLTKPFSVTELMARIRVSLRHKDQKAEPGEIPQREFCVGDLKIDFERRRIYLGAEEIHLTPHEYSLIALMARHAQVGLSIVLPWGSADEEARCRRLASSSQSALVPARLTLPEAALLLARAELCIGVDTGFTHLAAALGAPTVAIFTATEVTRHGVAVAGPHARDTGDAGASPDVETVMRAAADVWKAVPRC
jgi:hypothetical protein